MTYFQRVEQGRGGWVGDAFTVEEPGKHSPGEVIKVTSTGISHGGLVFPPHNGIQISLHLCGLPLEKPMTPVY